MTTTDINFQPSINLGTLGHVSHGKSTITRILTGTCTGKFKEEIERNMTIKLGYANFKIWKCQSCKDSHQTSLSKIMIPPLCKECNSESKLIKHISIIDSPGHADLIGTMLSGASVMDAAIMVISAKDICPSPQTIEHLIAAEEYNLTKKMIVVQNKIDSCSSVKEIKENKEKIDEFLKGTGAENQPIIPASAQLNVGVDELIKLLSALEEPKRDTTSSLQMNIIRTFDINKPGTKIENMKGGVIGGSILKGTAILGSEIEIRPGIIFKDQTYKPIITKINRIQSETNVMLSATPGGLITFLTDIDPYFTKSDYLVGQIVGIPGSLPEVYNEITVSYKLLHKTVDGSKTKINSKEKIMLCIGSKKCEGVLINKTKEQLQIKLDTLVCIESNSKITLFQNKRLIGIGNMISGNKCDVNVSEIKDIYCEVEDVKEEDVIEEKKEDFEEDFEDNKDEVDTLPESEIHNNRFYKNKIPKVDDLVMCEIVSVDKDVGAYAILKEYGNLTGFIALKQISTKRIKNIQKEVSVRMNEVCSVIGVDIKNGIIHIDLTRKHISDEDKKDKLNDYVMSKRLFQVINHLGIEYAKLGYKLHCIIKNMHPYDYLLKNSVESISKRIDIPVETINKVISGLKKNIQEVQKSNCVLCIKSTGEIANIKNSFSELQGVSYIGSSKYKIDIKGKNSLCDLKEWLSKYIDYCNKNNIYVNIIEAPCVNN